MSADTRIKALLAAPGVSCTLRRQPRHLSLFFYEALKQYSLLWVRSDRESEETAGLLNETFGLLKFVAFPNNYERKETLIDSKWPQLIERIEAKLS